MNTSSKYKNADNFASEYALDRGIKGELTTLWLCAEEDALEVFDNIWAEGGYDVKEEYKAKVLNNFEVCADAAGISKEDINTALNFGSEDEVETVKSEGSFKEEKTIILNCDNEIIKRSIRVDSEGDEYVLNNGMKGILEVVRIDETANSVVTVKHVKYYINK